MNSWRVRTVADRGTIFSSWIENRLCRLFSNPFFFDEPDAISQFDAALPIFNWSLDERGLSLLFIAQHKPHLGKFFSDMIHRWLIPGRKIDVSFSFAADVEVFEKKFYVLSEMAVGLGPEDDLELIERNLRIIETELRLGMVSVYHASRILEMRHGSEKGAQIQEKISALIHKRPDEIDYDVFGEMQHFLVLSKTEFKTARLAHHLSRLILLFYLFRKSVQKELEIQPEKRQVRCKVAEATLDLPWGMKKVVAIVVALGALKATELFEERHLIRAVQNVIPSATAIEDSFFSHEGVEDGIHVLYLEIEALTPLEMRTLQSSLPEEARRSIETAVRSVFLPRNEEEVMRNILSLAGQLRFVRDLPQLILTFLEQIGSMLAFQVILVRVVLPGLQPIAELFCAHETPLAFIPDRIKRVGMVRKKYPKEASVFEVRIASDRFLKDDYTVDLFRARQEVVVELQKIVGEVRDYNGGMIAKQLELLRELKSRLPSANRIEEMQLETLFHALYPIEMRSVLDAEPIMCLFSLWKKLLADPSKEAEFFEDSRAVYVMSRKERNQFQTAEEGVLVARPAFAGETFTGYALFSPDPAKRNAFTNSCSFNRGVGIATLLQPAPQNCSIRK